MNQPQTQSPLRHGRVTSPASRGAVAIDLGLLGGWQVNEMEGGKNFPALVAGPVVDASAAEHLCGCIDLLLVEHWPWRVATGRGVSHATST